MKKTVLYVFGAIVLIGIVLSVCILEGEGTEDLNDEHEGGVRHKRWVGGALKVFSRVNLFFGTAGSLMGLTCIGFTIQSLVDCGCSIVGYDCCGRAKVLDSKALELNKTLNSLDREEASSINYKNDLLNLLPALEKLGNNFEEITNNLFNIAQNLEAIYISGSTSFDPEHQSGEDAIRKRNLHELVINYQKLAKLGENIKVNPGMITGLSIGTIGSLTYFTLVCIPRFLNKIKAFPTVATDDIIMFNTGEVSDFKLGYDMKADRPFIAKKGAKMNAETFKMIVYLDEGLPIFGINDGVRYKANKALNENKNFKKFMNFLNAKNSRKDFINAMSGLDENKQTVVWKEIQRTGNPKEAGIMNFGDLENSMKTSGGDFDLQGFAKRRENFHSIAGGFEVFMPDSDKGYTNDLAADIDVGTESIRKQSQSGVPPPNPPPQPDYSFPDNVLNISPKIKSSSTFTNILNNLKPDQRNRLIDSIKGDENKQQILKDEMAKIGNGKPDGYTDSDDFMAKIAGDGDFNDGLETLFKKRAQKIPWYRERRAKWNKFKSWISRTTSSAGFLVGLNAFELAMSTANTVLCSIQIKDSVQSTYKIKQQLEDGINDCDETMSTLNSRITDIKQRINSDVQKYKETVLRPAVQLLDLLKGDDDAWGNTLIRRDKGGDKDAIIVQTEEEEYYLFEIEKETYTTDFGRLARLVSGYQYKTMAPRELKDLCLKVLTAMVPIKANLEEMEVTTRAVKFIQVGVNNDYSVPKIIEKVNDISQQQITQWETVKQIADITRDEDYQGFPVGCIRRQTITSATQLNEFFKASDKTILTDKQRIQLKTLLQIKIGLETMKSMLGLPTEDVLTAVAEMVQDDNIVLGGTRYDLRRYRGTGAC